MPVGSGLGEKGKQCLSVAVGKGGQNGSAGFLLERALRIHSVAKEFRKHESTRGFVLRKDLMAKRRIVTRKAGGKGVRKSQVPG